MMELNGWFWVAHAVALLGWGALLLSAGRREQMVRLARASAALIALGYLLVFLLNLRGMSVLARDYSVSGVSALFQNPNIALLGWVHYLAFDLWVGSWEVEEAGRLGMRHALLPCLLLTFAYGPLGLLFFLGAARLTKSRGRTP
jgi:hypothetical protein